MSRRGPIILRTFFGSICAHVSSALLVSRSITQQDSSYYCKAEDGSPDSDPHSSSSSSDQGCRSDNLSSGGEDRWAICWMCSGVGRSPLR